MSNRPETSPSWLASLRDLLGSFQRRQDDDLYYVIIRRFISEDQVERRDPACDLGRVPVVPPDGLRVLPDRGRCRLDLYGGGNRPTDPPSGPPHSDEDWWVAWRVELAGTADGASVHDFERAADEAGRLFCEHADPPLPPGAGDRFYWIAWLDSLARRGVGDLPRPVQCGPFESADVAQRELSTWRSSLPVNCFRASALGIRAVTSMFASAADDGEPTLRSFWERDVEDKAVEYLMRKRRAIPAALVEFMRNKTSSDFSTIKREVHGNEEVSDGALERNAQRTTEELAEEKIPISYTARSAHVFKEILRD